MSLLNTVENAVLDKLFSAQDFTPPTQYSMALYTTMPDDAGAGGVEVTGGSYARQTIANNVTEWPAASGGSKQPSNAISFPQASANWGTVLGWGLFADDGTFAGALVMTGELTTPTAVDDGQQAVFSAGSLTISCD